MSVNTSRTWYASDPFILAYQASQAFYLKYAKLGNSWQVVQKVTIETYTMFQLY
jgi:hypothetical protein